MNKLFKHMQKGAFDLAPYFNFMNNFNAVSPKLFVKENHENQD